MSERLKGKSREIAIARISGEMADKNGTLPHEERWMATQSLQDYEDSDARQLHRPLMRSLLFDLYRNP